MQMRFGKPVLVGIALFLVIASVSGMSSGPAVPPVSAPAKDSPKEYDVKSQMKFIASAWRKGGFDTALMVDFSLANHGDLDVKDVEITCTLEGSSGTKHGQTVRTVYAIVKAKSSQEFPNFNMGQMHTETKGVRCEITDVAFVE
jgi:hypothetical protein